MAAKISKGKSETDQFFKATQSGDVEKVREILECGKCTVNCTDYAGWTPLHWACKKGHVDVVRVLVSEFKADMTIQTSYCDTPLIIATINEHDNVVHALLSDYQCLVDAKGQDGSTALHYSCRYGHVDIVRTLVKHKANVNAKTNRGDTPLTLAVRNKHDNVVHALLSDSGCLVDAKGQDGYTALHYSCTDGHVDIVKILVSHKANVNARTDSDIPDTPLTLAAKYKHDNVVHALLSDSQCLVDAKGQDGYTALHYSCRYDYVDIVWTLVKHKANVNARTDSGDTPLTLAARHKHDNIVHALLSDSQCLVDAKGWDGYTVLHYSCRYGHVDRVRTLVNQCKVDVNARTDRGDTPLTLAARNEHYDVVHALLSDSQCLVDAKDQDGYNALHYSCRYGHVDIVWTLIKHKANVNARTDSDSTPLTLAARHGHDNVVHALLSDSQCLVDAKDQDGSTALHYSCRYGHVDIVWTLINHKANVNARTDSGSTPLTLAARHGHDNVVHALLSDSQCLVDTKDQDGSTALHYSCTEGHVDIVRALVNHKANVNARVDSGDTPLTLAAINKHDNVVHALSDYSCEVYAKDEDAFTALLLLSCERGYVGIVRTLLAEHKADINVKTDSGDTLLHVAARYGQLQVTMALIHEFNCDINVKGYLGRSLLHSACACSGSDGAVVDYVCRYLSPLLVDDNGDTPLHIACLNYSNNRPILKTLLKYNPPLLVRNKDGKIPLDMASSYRIEGMLDQYMRENIYADYSNIQTLAKKKYSSAEPITRIFVIGNPGAGKSSLVETLKREGFFESFRRVSESSVPLHTAGIVPSIHTSKHYGRSLFYDFAGDPEYYSSHAAILENLVSSKKGDNIFMIVVDLREESIKIREVLYYWLLFIQHQNLRKEPFLIIIGSHSDKVAREKVEGKRMELQNFCDKIQPGHGVLHTVAHFILDCRNPKHQHLGDIQELIVSFTKDSSRHKLSLVASTLLGLLEKDFSNEPAFSVSQLQSHIEVTHIALPRETQPLHSLLLELHDIGLLFIVNDSNKEHFHVVFNISKLTNEVHRLLFSAEAKLRLRKSCVESEGSNSSFNIGIIPSNVLEAILPENIPKECLVQLQYCQFIRHKDVGAFPSLTPSDSTDQSFLFFPALCSVDKSEVSWVTPPDLSYSIGWLARCTNPCDYFPPRFLHVLLLRVVFRFTLSVPAQKQASGSSPDHSHFQRLCTMWKTGVHWLMEEGVECMVELVNRNKDIIVTTKSIIDRTQNCTIVFSQIVSCVMEAKAEFCHSTKPQFFLLNFTDEDDYLSEDNQFPMSYVERILACPERKEVIISKSGNKQMEVSKLLSLRILTHWHNLFPIDFLSVHHLLKNVVDKVYDLGLELKVPYHTLEELETNFPTDVVKRRREVVKGWMSSTHHPPCWWHLVQALKRIGMNALAEEIQREHSKSHVLLEP